MNPQTHVPGTPRDLKEMLQQSVILASLENLMKLDEDERLRKELRRRYLELTDV